MFEIALVEFPMIIVLVPIQAPELINIHEPSL